MSTFFTELLPDASGDVFYRCKVSRCSKKIKKQRGGSAYNFERHVQVKHDDEYARGLASLGTTVADVNQLSSTDLSLAMLIFNGKLRANVVNDDDFIAFIRSVRRDKEWKPPCYQTLLHKHLPSMKCLIEEGLQLALASAPTVALTLDLWCNRLRHPYLAVTAHFTYKGALSVALLDLIRMSGSHTSSYIMREVDAVSDRFGIRGKVTSVVTDCGGNLIAAYPNGELSTSNYDECNRIVEEILASLDDLPPPADEDEADAFNAHVLDAWRRALDEVGELPPDNGRIYGKRCLAHLLQLCIASSEGCLQLASGELKYGKS